VSAAVQSGDVLVRFTVTEDWISGYQGEFKLTNKGTRTVANWTLDFDQPQQISSAWEATIQGPGHYVATPVSWTSSIAPGATVSFGFLASPGNVKAAPTNIRVNTGTVPPTPTPTPSPTPVPTPSPTATPQPSPSATPSPTPVIEVPEIDGRKIVGYYPEWGVYARNFKVTDIPAGQLNVINYAFANVNAAGDVYLFDSYAATELSYPGDKWDQPLRGNLNQLNKLKAANPHLRTMISIGGWTLSDYFSDFAATAAGRSRFAISAVTFMRQYGFDGVDIDWEYPVGGGEPGNHNRPEDRQNFTLLLQEVRLKLDAAGAADGRKYYLTIAAPAGAETLAHLELAKVAAITDWINLMAYDFHGGWESVTDHNAPITGPSASDTNDVQSAVDAYLAAGVPAAKLVLGAPFYGRGWSNVGSANNGLRQSGVTALGTYDAGERTGMFDYRDIAAKLSSQPQAYKRYWDSTSQTPFIYAPSVQGGLWISYDDPQSIRIKAQYIKTRGLGGMMVWDLSNDTREDSLLSVVHSELK
jgi:chitinase